MNLDLVIQGFTSILQLCMIILGFLFLHSFRTKILIEKTKQINDYAKIVVASVEQTLGSGNGADKKEEARQAMRIFTRGKLNEVELDHFIESAVYGMNAQKAGK